MLYLNRVNDVSFQIKRARTSCQIAINERQLQYLILVCSKIKGCQSCQRIRDSMVENTCIYMRFPFFPFKSDQISNILSNKKNFFLISHLNSKLSTGDGSLTASLSTLMLAVTSSDRSPVFPL